MGYTCIGGHRNWSLYLILVIMNGLRSRYFCLLTCLGISACAPPTKVAVEERDVVTVRQESERMGGQLIRFAQPGDTLHSIAFATGLDVNRVAAWNGIEDTSKLFVGQRIRLTKPIGFQYSKPKPEPRPEPKRAPHQPQNSSPELPESSNRKPEDVAQNNPSNSAPGTQPPHSSSGNAQETPPQMRPAGEIRWRWPTKGEVLTRFALNKGQQGIDIGAVRGQSVMASDRGEVVYVGNSLKGYGNLIIVKHTEEFLSAYAHNENIFVNEGQSVQAQQKIATVGTNNKRENALHFQIRRNGRPVNPLLYLPKI